MTLLYSEEQRLLADTARSFLADRSPVTLQRRLRDERVALGFDAALWREIAGLGWTAIPFPESLGGLDFGCKGLGAVFEEMGRTLCATPMLSGVVLAGTALRRAGSEAQQRRWLPAMIEGGTRVALAVDEGPHHDPLATSLKAERDGDGFRLSGGKTFVTDGAGADAWLVAARSAGQPGEEWGLSLFLVERTGSGVGETALALIDSRNHADLRFDGVRVGADALVGDLDGGWPVLDEALDHGRVCLAAEMLGAAQQLFETTVDYLKTRVQFDVPIGSFQALQHRAAWLYVHLEMARSAVMGGLDAMDDAGLDRQEKARLASLAKWKAGETAARVSNEAVQMHGGIGVTDELDVGLFLKRIRVAQACLGDSDFHAQRYDALTRSA